MLGEPFTWLHHYFWQIDDFVREFEMRNSATRLKLLFRLILPMFLISYPLAVIFRFVLLYFSGFQFNWANLLFATGVGTISGIIVGIGWDIVANMPVGILGSMWLGMWLGILAGSSWRGWIGILITTIGSL